jgi:hypothetical protein
MSAPFKRGLGFFAVVLTGWIVAFYSQASSPDYRALWWTMLFYAAIHLVALNLYFVRVPYFSRWLAVLVGVVAIQSFAELSLRVWP